MRSLIEHILPQHLPCARLLSLALLSPHSVRQWECNLHVSHAVLLRSLRGGCIVSCGQSEMAGPRGVMGSFWLPQWPFLGLFFFLLGNSLPYTPSKFAWDWPHSDEWEKGLIGLSPLIHLTTGHGDWVREGVRPAWANQQDIHPSRSIISLLKERSFLWPNWEILRLEVKGGGNKASLDWQT